MALQQFTFNGHQAVRIESGESSLVVATSIGPHVLGLIGPDGSNALAELPDVTVDCPGTGPSHLYGGHRLWAGPEDPRVTYRPQDEPVEVEETDLGVRLTGPADDVAGVARSIDIAVEGPSRFALTHRVRNTADEPQTLAPWAITMLPSGGRAWLPLLAGPHDAGGFQANRNVVLWPYTQLDDRRLLLTDATVEIRTDAADLIIDAPVKVGTAIRRGWLAHWRDGLLFVKRARHDESRRYADLSASAQVYWNGAWGELETLGPLETLALGEAADYVEEWEVRYVGESEAELLVTSGELDQPSNR